MIGNNNPPCPRDYVCYHTEYEPNRGSHGSSAIFVRHDVAHTHINLETTLQAVAVQLHLKKKYTVLSLYLPPSDAISRRNLLNLFHQLPSPFLVLGDFNGRHHMWGDEVSNQRGNIVADIIEEDISVLNVYVCKLYY